MDKLGPSAWGALPYGFSANIVQLLEPKDEVERVGKAGHYSYKSEGKKKNQEAMFPELMKEIEEKRKA